MHKDLYRSQGEGGVGEWPMARLEHAEKKRCGVRRGIGGDARGSWGPWSESVQRSDVGTYGSRTALRGRGRSLGRPPPPKSSGPSSSGDEERRILLRSVSHHGHTLPLLLLLYSFIVGSWSLLIYWIINRSSQQQNLGIYLTT